MVNKLFFPARCVYLQKNLITFVNLLPQRHQGTKDHKDNLVAQITQITHIFLNKLCVT